MCAETIITEQAEWNPESNIVTMLSLNTVLKWVWRAQQEGLDVIIVNPGVIIGPVPDQGVANLLKVSGGCLLYAGTTGFISVTDVVSISYELMNSTIKK
jgi:nucleoside-diphosphate-sugar epimerase